MRSSKAKGRYGLRGKRLEIKKIVETAAARGKLTIHEFANVGNHLHLLISFKSRASFQRFLKEVTGLVARVVTGARKGKPFGRFWDELAFSRVITRLKDLRNVLDYVFMNRIEGTFGSSARANLAGAKRTSGGRYITPLEDG